MKHWIDFIEHKTHETKLLGQLSNSLQHDIEYKNSQLNGLEESFIKNENKLIDKIKPFYCCNETTANVINEARKKADLWNSTPTNKLKPKKNEY